MKPKAEVTIFLAHASEDKVRVIELYNKLKGQGYSPWLDKIDLMPGQLWEPALKKALKQSDIFIACLSETSIKNKRYVQSEYRLALRQAAEMPADAIFLIPLRFDACEIPDLEQAEYGIKLQDFQWLDYWEAGAFERLVAAIEYGRGKLEVLAKEGGQEKKSEIAQQYQEEETGSFQEGTALKIWQGKLARFQQQEAITANIAEKFELGVRIKECQEKIKELENEEKTKIVHTKGGDKEEAKLRQYRELVQEYLEDHRISNAEKVLLERKRKELGITEPEAEKILAEEQAPILQAREEYGELLVELIKAECYPFDAETQKALEKIKQEKQLKEWEGAEIEQNSLKKAEYQQFEIVTVDEKGKIIKREPGFAKYFSEDLGEGVSLEMMLIPSGRFTMGSTTTEEGSYDDERPQHEVNISSFYMGRYPITQAQWRAIAELAPIDRELNSDPSGFKDSYEGQQRWTRPVESINWYDAVEFCKRLSRETGKEYRLPSEAEWEYACCAGTTTPFHFGETVTTDLANYRGTDWEYQGKIYPGNYRKGVKGIFREQTTPVGYFGVANGYGLSDLHGNVWEWCLDDRHDDYKGVPRDGRAWISNDNHSHHKRLRGGSWYYVPRVCRSASRYWGTPDSDNFYVGFRVVCVGAGLFPSAL